jgi:DMSO/TMAO reductase YedYZ heme-binding membrane subunit
MNQTSTRLGARDRALVAFGAIAVLAVLAALQCPALAVEAATRSGLMSAATLLALLCVSILVEDLLVQPLRAALRRLAHSAPGLVR